MRSGEEFDREADIVVVGFGGAGIAAAVTARRMGASVLVIEKQSRKHHTPSTKMSGGLVMAAHDALQATDYLDACAGGLVARDISQAWAEKAAGLVDWLHMLAPGLDLRRVGGGDHPEFAGFDTIDVYQPGGATRRHDPRGKAGVFLFGQLSGAVVSQGAEILWEQPVDRLIRTDDGNKVTGVVTTGGLKVRAREGVVLASGGFQQDEALKREYLAAVPLHFYGNPGNTGDGLRMAQEVGADLWHMNAMAGAAVGHFSLPDGREVCVPLFLDPPGYVITDAQGNRFTDESVQAERLAGFHHHMLAFDPVRRTHPRNPAYWFFDENRRRAGRLTLPSLGAAAVGLYQWSEDNSREIEQGWIASGETIAEAAGRAGLSDPERAGEVVEAYNRDCRDGRADAFGRPEETMVPLAEPPFYCVRLAAGGSNTRGGPRRNRHAQVLDTRGAPIAGLYGAGELGQATGLLCPSDGANLSEAFCFGQIAAESALSMIGGG